MGLGYGSIIELNPVTSEQIGPGETAKPSGTSAWWTVLSWLITAAEIGISFIPGLNWAGITAIAATAAGARLGLEAGKVGGAPSVGSFITEGIGVALPGAIRAVSLARTQSKFTDLISNISETVSDNKINLSLAQITKEYGGVIDAERLLKAKDYMEGVVTVDSLVTAKVTGGGTIGEIVNRAQNTWAKEVFNGLKPGTAEFSRVLKDVKLDYAKYLTSGRVSNIGSETSIGVARETEFSLARKLNLTELETSAINTFLKQMRSAYNELDKANIYERMISYLKSVNRNDRLALSDFLRKVSAGNKHLSNIDFAAIEAGTLAEFGSQEKAYESLLLGSLTKSGKETKGLIRNAWLRRQALKRGKQVEEHIDRAITNSRYNWKKALKNPGSEQFNSLVLQKAQMIDPTDLGRTPVELVYRKARKYILDKFRKAGILGRKLSEFEKLYAKNGGTLLDSDWLLGYKILTTIPISGLNMTMLSFRPNKNGAQPSPVIIFPTINELKLLREGTGTYYIRRWAYFRNGPGGKKHASVQLFSKAFRAYKSSALAAVSAIPWPIAQNVRALQWLRPNAIRNILSLTSNWVENISAMVKGEYFNTWGAKAGSSAVRTLISRSLRLITSTFLGGTIGHFMRNSKLSALTQRALGKDIGRLIGTEAQRLTTNTINVMIQNGINGVGVTTGLTLRTYINSYGRAATSFGKGALRARIRTQKLESKTLFRINANNVAEETRAKQKQLNDKYTRMVLDGKVINSAEFDAARSAIYDAARVKRSASVVRGMIAKEQINKNILLINSTKRKADIWGRIPNAAMPGRPFSKKKMTWQTNSSPRKRNHGTIYNALLP